MQGLNSIHRRQINLNFDLTTLLINNAKIDVSRCLGFNSDADDSVALTRQAVTKIN